MHYTSSLEKDGKPEIISFYNSTKGIVDLLDQLVHSCSSTRKINRWPLAFFMNCLYISWVAAYVMGCNLIREWSKQKQAGPHFTRPR